MDEEVKEKWKHIPKNFMANNINKTKEISIV